MLDKSKLKFERLSTENTLLIKDWGFHRNPLFYDYNIRIRNIKEARFFKNSKTLMPYNRYFAIFYEDYMEGFIGLKRINPITRASTLGLVLNPDVVGQGLGSLALREFLNMYFTDFKMRKMYLQVANYNLRAMKLYKNLGFKIIKIESEPYPNGSIDFENPFLYDLEDKFFLKKGKWYYDVITMEINREEFYEVFNRK